MSMVIKICRRQYRTCIGLGGKAGERQEKIIEGREGRSEEGKVEEETGLEEKARKH